MPRSRGGGAGRRGGCGGFGDRARVVVPLLFSGLWAGDAGYLHGGDGRDLGLVLVKVGLVPRGGLELLLRVGEGGFGSGSVNRR